MRKYIKIIIEGAIPVFLFAYLTFLNMQKNEQPDLISESLFLITLSIGASFVIYTINRVIDANGWDFKIKFKDFKQYYTINPNEYRLYFFSVKGNGYTMYFGNIDHIKYLLFRHHIKRDKEINKEIENKRNFLNNVQKDIDAFKKKVDEENEKARQNLKDITKPTYTNISNNRIITLEIITYNPSHSPIDSNIYGITSYEEALNIIKSFISSYIFMKQQGAHYMSIKEYMDVYIDNKDLSIAIENIINYYDKCPDILALALDLKN